MITAEIIIGIVFIVGLSFTLYDLFSDQNVPRAIRVQHITPFRIKIPIRIIRTK